MNNKIKYYAILILLCINGCAGVKAVLKSIEEPEIELKDINLTIFPSQITGTLEIFNPNNFKIPMPKVTAEIFLEGSKIGDGYIEYGGLINANSTFKIPATIDINFLSSFLHAIFSYFVTQNGNIRFLIDVNYFKVSFDAPWALESGKPKIKGPAFETLQLN